MKHLIVLGAGTAGTSVANQMRGRLPDGWALTVVDPEPQHLFQPDLIFVPFGMQAPERTLRPREHTLRGVRWMQRSVESVDTDKRRVLLDNGDRLRYDLLVIASGSHIRPQETGGLMGDEWQRSIFDFYTLEGASKLGEALAAFEGGRIVVDIVEMPIKCPVAPLEITFLTDSYFTGRGSRDQVELLYVTPLDGAFTKPIASRVLGSMLTDRGIRVEAEFNTSEVDCERKVLRSWDEREIPFDLLITIPTHMGAPFIEASGLGDELAFVPTDETTLLAKGHDDIFVLGDATNLQTSKAGSVAHFQSEVVVENLQRAIAGKSLVEGFDGHANCFIESGFGKAMLIDFNYDQEPLPGIYPYPFVGPFPLLKESRRNHWGKLAFRWVYWNMLLPGRPIPVPNRMSMAGKRQLPETETQLAA
jgi:sulfide:quinone oxidoreductase